MPSKFDRIQWFPLWPTLLAFYYIWLFNEKGPSTLRVIGAIVITFWFFGAWFNLLPFLMTGLSVLASALHRHDAMDDASFGRHKRNLVLMALAFLLLFYTFPAGMVLYWTTNNLISVSKSLWARR